jgi:hypothetical protein
MLNSMSSLGLVTGNEGSPKADISISIKADISISILREWPGTFTWHDKPAKLKGYSDLRTSDVRLQMGRRKTKSKWHSRRHPP